MPARSFSNQPAAVTQARYFVLEVLVEQTREMVAEVELMVSELASNCVRHTDSERFEIEIEAGGESIRVAATDWGAGTPAMRRLDPMASSGRGLVIIDALSAEWGIEPLAAERSGKTVWFTVPAAGAALAS